MIRKLLCAFIAVLAVAVLAIIVGADDTKPNETDKKTPWKAEDFVFTENASQFRISPDCKWVVWVKNTADKEKDGRISNLYLSSLTEKKEIQLTRGTDDVSSPRWSPSGDMIAFMSSRALPKPKPDFAHNQLWLMNVGGGEPWHVTEFERGIQQFEWLDSNTILFSAEEDPSLYERDTKEHKDDSDIVDDEAHTPPVRLFKFSVKDKKVTRLTDNTDWIQSFEPSYDGKKAVAVARRELSYAWDEKTPPVTYIVDLTTGARTQIFPGRKLLPDRIRWARDNSGFYVVAPFSDSPRFYTASIQKLYFYDLASSSTTEVNLDWERSLGFNLEITKDGFITLLDDGVYKKACAIHPQWHDVVARMDRG